MNNSNSCWCSCWRIRICEDFVIISTKKIPGKQTLAEIQKIVIISTAYILRKALLI